MVVRGVVHNGVIVPNEPLQVPEGTQVSIEIEASPNNGPIVSSSVPRKGGWLKGQVTISSDFDELPDEIGEAFGMK